MPMREETKLLALTGASAENPTMSLSCRTVLGTGQKPIAVHSPFREIEEERCGSPSLVRCGLVELLYRRGLIPSPHSPRQICS
jgi:hypothetical protein